MPRGLDKRVLLDYRSHAHRGLGVAYSEMERFTDAEMYHRLAIHEYQELKLVYGQHEQIAEWWTENERCIGETLNSLAILLRKQDKMNAMQKLIEEKVLPFWIRQMLGPTTTDAQVQAFDDEVALTVPLPNMDCVDALARYHDRQADMQDFVDRHSLLLVMRRVMDRCRELQGPDHPVTIVYVRQFMSWYEQYLPSPDLEELYRQ